MKVILTEDQFNRLILKEGKLNDMFKKFNITQIKKELKERLDIDETSTKMEVAKKLIKYIYNLNLKLLKYELGAVLGGFIFYFLSIVLDVAGVEPFVTDGEPTIPHFILWGAGALLNVIRMVMKVKLTEQQFIRVILKEDEELTPFHAKAFEYMDRRYSKEDNIGEEYAYYYPAKFKDEFQLNDDESKLLAYNYLKYNDGSGDYKKFIGKPFYTPDNLSLDMEELDLGTIRVRFTLNNKDLRNLLPPKALLPTTEIITLMNDNISHVDVTGYEKFSNLFILNLLGNPVRTVNIPTLIEFLNNHPTMARFSMNYIPNEEFNEEHVQFIKDSLREDSGINIEITPLPED